jgi:hypothetical protein
MSQNVPVLLLKFAVILTKSERFKTHGPIFTKWLPNGENDSISVNIDNLNGISANLNIWFERRGFVQDGRILFDYRRKEVDPKIMSIQEILDAGPLFGLIKISGLTIEDIKILSENKIGNDRYVDLGKIIVKKIIFPNVYRIINIIRINYGQYWIEPINSWDSRIESLGSYCQNIELKWSSDGKNWQSFIPNEPISYVTLQLREAGKEETISLTEKDWQDISELSLTNYDPTLAAECLARTNELLNQGNLKYAIIEAVTALEIALDELIREKLESYGEVRGDHIRIFNNLDLQSRLKMAVTFINEISQEDLKLTINAIVTRNKIVHDGFSPGDDIINEIIMLQKSTAILIKKQKFKFIT